VFSGTPEIKWNQVAFLKHSQQTWTHGIFFGKEVDDLLAQRDAEIAELKRLVAALTPTE